MRIEESTIIEQACRRLLLRSISIFDERNWLGFSELFTSDGLFYRAIQPNEPLTGRAAILAALAARPADRLTRHLCTNIEIDVVDNDHATGRCYLYLFSAAGNPPEKAIGGPADKTQRLGEYADDYVRTAEGWRIARRVGRIIMHMGS